MTESAHYMMPLSTLELLEKYPQLKNIGRLKELEGEAAQKVYCEITELIRQLDFKASGGRFKR